MHTSTDNWQKHSRCATIHPIDADMFFAADSSFARQLCKQCSVSDHCAQEAMTRGEQHGVWGGMTPPELKQLCQQGDAA